MPNNDDLFSGMTIGSRQVPNRQQQAAKAAGINTDDSDLFAGLTIGKASIPQLQQDPLQGPVRPGEQLVELAPAPQPLAATPFPKQPGETRAAAELPEVAEVGVGDLLGKDSGAKAAAITPVLLATTDPGEFASILQSNFPDSIGIQTSPAGEVIVTNNDTGQKALVNRAGFSPTDALQALGIAAAFTPAGRAAAIPATLAPKVAAGAAAAGLTQTGIEAIQGELGGTLDEDEIAIASALGGAAELVLPAIQALRSSRQAAKLGVERAEVAATREVIAPAREATEALEAATGRRVGLFPAQQTQVPSELLKQRILPQLDAGSKRAASALERQNKEVFDATSELINTVSPAEAIGGGSARFRTAAKKAVQSGKDRRSAETRVLFKDAMKAGADVDVSPVRSLIDEKLLDAPEGGEIVKAMTRVKGFIADKTVDEAKVSPTLRQLQKAKFELDNMLEKFGENALGNTTKRDVVEVKRLLVNQMEEASPLFKQANDRFAELSPAVSELENSILGQVSKVSDVNLKGVAQRIFDPKSGLTDPTTIKNAKRIIDQVDPGAWDDLLRVEMNRRVGAMEQLIKDTPELVGNEPAAMLRSLFGNPAQRNALLSGMGADQRKNFVYLERVLKRAASGRAAGSPTASFGQAIERLKGTASVLRDAIFRPLRTAGETGERALFDRNVSRLADVMFDTNFQPQMKRLRELDPNSPAAARAMSQLLNPGENNNGQ